MDINYKDEEWLKTQYRDNNLSISEIAKTCAVNPHTITAWVRNFKILKLHQDQEWVRRQYIDNKLSTIEIGRLCKSHPSTIVGALQKFGISSRTTSDSIIIRWQNAQYKDKLLLKFRSKEHRDKLKKVWDNEYRRRQSGLQSQVWSNSEYKRRQSDIHRQLWNSPEYRSKIIGHLRSKENRARAAKASQAMWADPSVVAKYRTPEHREKLRAIWLDQAFRVKMRMIYSNPEYKAKISAIARAMWENSKFKAKASGIYGSVEHRALLSIIGKTFWANPNNKKSALIARADQARRKVASESAKQCWKNPIYYANAVETSKRLWQNPEYRAKILAIFSTPEHKIKMARIRSALPHVSSLQVVFYSILDDLGVKYFREYVDKPADKECLVGPWTFDCAIPRENKPILLVECNGDWVHSSKEQQTRDKQKASYVAQMPQYELKTIWEHEFSNLNRIVDLLKHWLGIIRIEPVEIDLNSVVIRKCAAEEAKLLLSKYHYSYRPNGIIYGAFLANELIAACIFRMGDEIRLSSICINPKYAIDKAWLADQCIGLLPPRNIITNIAGLNGFMYYGDEKCEDWYVGDGGWKMLGKTLHRHAANLKMAPGEFAALKGYRRIEGESRPNFRLLNRR